MKKLIVLLPLVSLAFVQGCNDVSSTQSDKRSKSPSTDNQFLLEKSDCADSGKVRRFIEDKYGARLESKKMTCKQVIIEGVADFLQQNEGQEALDTESACQPLDMVNRFRDSCHALSGQILPNGDEKSNDGQMAVAPVIIGVGGLIWVLIDVLSGDSIVHAPEHSPEAYCASTGESLVECDRLRELYGTSGPDGPFCTFPSDQCSRAVTGCNNQAYEALSAAYLRCLRTLTPPSTPP
jgi:hypothetical protein